MKIRRLSKSKCLIYVNVEGGTDRGVVWGGGISPPTWISKIYGFQGVSRPQQVLSPPGKKQKFKHPGQIPDYSPGSGYFNYLNFRLSI